MAGIGEAAGTLRSLYYEPVMELSEETAGVCRAVRRDGQRYRPSIRWDKPTLSFWR
jgi:hypothetical protein